MLRLELSKFVRTTNRPVAVGSTVTAEGQALVADTPNGGVRPSTGAAGEIFVGFAISQQLTILSLPRMEELTLADLKVTLAETPVTGSLRLINRTRGTDLTAGSAAGNYSITGKVVTVVAGGATQNGDVIVPCYRFVPTTLQALGIQGNIPPGGAAGLLLNDVGVVEAGDIVTTEFDTTVDWTSVSAANPIKLGANGMLTLGGSGSSLGANAFVSLLPAAGAPYLGVHISV